MFTVGSLRMVRRGQSDPLPGAPGANAGALQSFLEALLGQCVLALPEDRRLVRISGETICDPGARHCPGALRVPHRYSALPDDRQLPLIFAGHAGPLGHGLSRCKNKIKSLVEK